jgi:hypothetical protein
MKFDCGPTLDERVQVIHERRKTWRQWFAWRPVRIGRQCVWLETIERKGEFDAYGFCWVYEYRHASRRTDG